MPIPRRWPVKRNGEEGGEGRGHMSKHRGHGVAKLVGLSKNIRTDAHFAHNTHLQLRHLLAHIHRLPILPPLLNLFTIFHHQVCITANVPRLKRGSYQLALSPVEIPLANEDSIANQGTKCLMHSLPFIKIVGVLDKNVVHILRCIERTRGKGPKWKQLTSPHSCIIRINRLRRSRLYANRLPTTGGS